MEKENLREVWQRGPVEGVPALLQPVAHALLQVKEELHQQVTGLPAGLLWQKPGNAASIAFHLQHLGGVLDRLFTYARGEMLSAAQLQSLSEEGKENQSIDVNSLLKRFDEQVEKSLDQLKKTDPGTLTESRGIGRAQIPTTVIGLLFHAAEHSMRHLGQLIVTIKVLIHPTV